MNVALESDGAQVTQSSSWDPRHPPEAVIDGSSKTFWATTGFYPQELVITFDSTVSISKIESETCNARTMVLHRSAQNTPIDFNPVCTTELDDTDGQVQVTEHKISDTAVRHLKIEIRSGYESFCGVYKITVMGEKQGVGGFG